MDNLQQEEMQHESVGWHDSIQQWMTMTGVPYRANDDVQDAPALHATGGPPVQEANRGRGTLHSCSK